MPRRSQDEKVAADGDHVAAASSWAATTCTLPLSVGSSTSVPHGDCLGHRFRAHAGMRGEVGDADYEELAADPDRSGLHAATVLDLRESVLDALVPPASAVNTVLNIL
jgi:hypothetical protein